MRQGIAPACAGGRVQDGCRACGLGGVEGCAGGGLK